MSAWMRPSDGWARTVKVEVAIEAEGAAGGAEAVAAGLAPVAATTGAVSAARESGGATSRAAILLASVPMQN